MPKLSLTLGLFVGLLLCNTGYAYDENGFPESYPTSYKLWYSCSGGPSNTNVVGTVPIFRCVGAPGEISYSANCLAGHVSFGTISYAESPSEPLTTIKFKGDVELRPGVIRIGRNQARVLRLNLFTFRAYDSSTGAEVGAATVFSSLALDPGKEVDIGSVGGGVQPSSFGCNFRLQR